MLYRGGRPLALPCLIVLAACGGPDTPEIPALTVLTAELPSGALGAAYDQKVAATGGVAPYTFSIKAGELPTGLQLLPDQGRLTGNLGSPGPHRFTLEVQDAAGTTATQDLSLYVTPEALVVTTEALDEAFTVTAYLMRLSAQGGVPPLTWSLDSGTLPAGLVLSSDGRLAGTPTETGTFELGVQVNDAEDTAATKSLMLTVRSGTPMIVTETLPPALVGDRYEVRLEATGGQAPYTWTVQTGTVPAGLTLQDDGLLFGSAEAAGEFVFGVELKDSAENVDNKAFTLQAFEPLSVATRSLPAAGVDSAYDFQLEAAGGLAPYSWSTTDPLPPGITLSDSGRLMGTPTQLGSWTMRIRVQDALQGVPRSARFTLSVRDARIYEVHPALSFPPICTATTVSYQTVEIPVPDSFAISTITVDIDIEYADTEANNRSRLKLVLWAPDGRRTVLCGNGAGVRGSSGCSGTGNLQVTYGGSTGVSPQVPLRVFEGMNPQGTWRLQAAVVKPTTAAGNCEQAGVIQRITLSMEPDPSADPYVIIGGFTYNNLLIDPWVRIAPGGLPQQQIHLTATLWHAGSNGLREGGRGDDQPDPVQFTFTGADNPVGTTVAPDGTVNAGPDTSRASPLSSVTAVDATGTYTVTRPLHVTPPDWNPMIRNY